jgi:arylsulfatase
MECSRRDFVKLAGAGAAAAGLSSAIPVAPAAAKGAVAVAAALPETLAVDIRQRLEAGELTDPLAASTVKIAENMEPVIPHADQAAVAQQKLAALAQRTGKKPNILIFMMDNIGWGEPGIYGGGLMSGAPTPNIDRLGREGLQLLSTYSQPSCTPTRCTLLTGRLPMRTGALRPSFAGEPGILDNEITVARLLSEAGYFTQAVGKWHLGENLESQPQMAGFDDFYGFLGWSGLYTDWQDVEFAPEFALNPDRQALVRSIPFNDHVVHGVKGQEVENLKQISKEVSAELDEMFAAYSETFIEQMAESDQPFFLYHCTRGAHWKNYVNPKFQGKSPAKYPYKDCVVEMDDVLGRLVAKLEATGQLENTLIFVTSDNGPAIEPWPDAGYTPFRGGIGGTWEGSMRVPGVVYWKDMITPGQVNDGLFDLADLFLTSLALAGIDYRPPEEQYLDAIDQTSFLLADGGLSNRKYVYYWLQDVFSALRVAEYKFMLAGMSEDEPDVVNPGSSTVLESYKNGKLYNLYLDPRERFSFFNRQTFMDNLFSAPIVAHKETFKQYSAQHDLKAQLLDFLHSR